GAIDDIAKFVAREKVQHIVIGTHRAELQRDHATQSHALACLHDGGVINTRLLRLNVDQVEHGTFNPLDEPAVEKPANKDVLRLRLHEKCDIAAGLDDLINRLLDDHRQFVQRRLKEPLDKQFAFGAVVAIDGNEIRRVAGDVERNLAVEEASAVFVTGNLGQPVDART